MVLSDILKLVYHRIFCRGLSQNNPTGRGTPPPDPSPEVRYTEGSRIHDLTQDTAQFYANTHESTLNRADFQPVGISGATPQQCPICKGHYPRLEQCETCGGSYCENCMDKYDLHNTDHLCDICQTYHQQTSLCPVCNARCCTICQTRYDLHGSKHQCNGCGEFYETLVFCEVCEAYYCFRCFSDYAVHVGKHQCDRCGEYSASLRSIDGKKVCGHCFTVLFRASIGSAKTGKVVSTGNGGARHPSSK